MSNISRAVEALNKGKVIAYPTEGVFGLGCDPDDESAIKTLLAIKQRPVEKGLILIAASYEQLMPYIDDSQLSSIQREQIQKSWPGPVTWVMPKGKKSSVYISGEFDTVAVRVTDHPLVIQLCREFGKPIISTSANLTQQPACKTTEEVTEQLGQTEVVIIAGETGGRDKPSEIKDSRTMATLRQG